MQQYRKKAKTSVIAVQLDLDTKGFDYQKWGGTQRCKRGDWLVNNYGDVYTVDKDTFDRTYRQVTPGIYEKTAPVWAREADKGGSIQTKEGSTAYEAGDYLVYNDAAGEDGYAMKSTTFQSLYEPFIEQTTSTGRNGAGVEISNEELLLKRIYAQFNAREMEGVLAAMHPDVIWANGMEGGHVRGRNEVRSYWTRQWAMVDPRVEPVQISPGSEGETVVEVHQVVRDLEGNLIEEKMVGHLFRIRNGLIERFDIRGT